MGRIFIAAAHKSSGKTVISAGLTAALTARGQRVQAFKKGPDYIDPMWLAAASGGACYNLDFNTMRDDELLELHSRHAAQADISLIEANKGLFDGVDPEGADCNAAVAKLLKAPVILVVDTVGMTRGIAPLLQGYQAFDTGVNIAGVILNKVGGPRHESKLRAAVAAYTDIPVIGAIHKNAALEIGERHLGLTTPSESGEVAQKINGIANVIADSVDLNAVLAIACLAPEVSVPIHPVHKPIADVSIGIAQDSAFGFYYPDDLQALENSGARLVYFDTMRDPKLPDVDALLIGGGFPETQMVSLAENVGMRASIRHAIKSGMPAYAECGGLMYLCKTLEWRGKKFDMVGAIDGHAVMNARPQGRGYARLRGAFEFPAHEFHYAHIERLPKDTKFAYEVLRGQGIDGSHDGIMLNNLTAGFCHQRHTSQNPWATRFVDFVRAKKMPR